MATSVANAPIDFQNPLVRSGGWMAARKVSEPGDLPLGEVAGPHLYFGNCLVSRAFAVKKGKDLPEGAEKKRQQDLYDGYLKNIQNEELRKTVT